MPKVFRVLMAMLAASVALFVGVCFYALVQPRKPGEAVAGSPMPDNATESRRRSSKPRVGDSVFTRAGGYYACSDQDLLGQYIDAAMKQDATAKLSLMRRGCLRLPDGARARIEDTKAFSNDVLIRVYGLDGDTVVWTTTNALVGYEER